MLNVFSNIKGIIKEVIGVIDANDSIYKLIYRLKRFSLLVVILIILLERYDFRNLVVVELGTKHFELFGMNLQNDCVAGLIIFGIYSMILAPKITEYAVNKWKKANVYWPIKETIEDICGFLFYMCIALKVVCDLILCIAGIDVINIVNSILFSWIILNVVLEYICSIYKYNKEVCEYRQIRYTDFFDVEGERIAESHEVVYRNRLYRLHKEGGIWYMNTRDERFLTKELTLENAASDVEGKLRIYRRKGL